MSVNICSLIRAGRVKPFLESESFRKGFESSHQDFRVKSSRVIRIFLSRLESEKFSTRAESSQIVFVIFTFSVYLIKNVNKTFFYYTLSVSQLLCTKTRIRTGIYKLEWQNYYRFINKIRTVKSTLLFYLYLHYNKKASFLRNKKTKHYAFYKQNYLLTFIVMFYCILKMLTYKNVGLWITWTMWLH